MPNKPGRPPGTTTVTEEDRRVNCMMTLPRWLVDKIDALPGSRGKNTEKAYKALHPEWWKQRGIR